MDKNKFLKISDLQRVTVIIPMDDGPEEMIIQEMTLEDRIEVEDKHDEALGSFSALLLVASAVDAGGNRIFDWEDAKIIDSLPGTRFSEAITTARRISLIGKKAEADAESKSSTQPAASGG